MAVDNLPSYDIDALTNGDARLKGQFFLLLGDIIELINRNEVQFGTGSPETVLTANKGARYFDTAAAPGANFYIKTTDNINTGWVLV